ncbi:hypothetical protein PNH38_01645 [Anoxybacillus rupiensis]|jgi:hypothetical protein|uniref:Uncharacterized protein n=1 Tax=Anoxybacteroides rupiense TaxID=311460 RepID=A0ABD5IRA9_9BACL|nr:MULTISPECIES: hypothetical protein [Anoxybacillus]KXG11267.1 hypothetical protein AT864_00350 [Anoxybacillus sp. P3H1B]MBB3906845.1 hypothetical protein [Anoxybacillus rupiensis]MBS2770046.1 hypothetical protein [Anoxybacillus rupiensis]MDE8562581.1 hypothetical protein [Anoxybacillus rupiensis]MED5050827.1 hypothetical protein [Anoxybacillus rupiensis]
MIKRYALSPFEQINSTILDQDEEWVIVSQLPNLISSYETLFELEQPTTTTSLFSDYGFLSANGRFYLFASLVTAFSIVDGDPLEIDMFLLQLEEYMIAQESTGTIIYWIDGQYEELLVKNAAVYHVVIHIFDLDKMGKND